MDISCILMPVTAEGKKSNQHSSADSLAAQIYFETVQAARQSSHLSQVYCSSNRIKSNKDTKVNMFAVLNEAAKFLLPGSLAILNMTFYIPIGKPKTSTLRLRLQCVGYICRQMSELGGLDLRHLYWPPLLPPPWDTSWLYTPLALRVHWNKRFLCFQNHFRF